MDSWNQERMFSNNQGQRMMHHQQQQQAAQLPYNANPSQGFYRPTNPQQFYVNPGVPQSHHGYQPSQVYSGHMNAMPQQFMATALQSQQHFKQMTQAEQDDMRKKKNFEEQQRRLLALKQRGPGHTQKTQMDNPLDNLFGNKGSSNASSLLGSLGNASKPKDSAVFQGPVVSGQMTTGFSAATSDYHSAPVTNAAPGLQNSNSPGSNNTVSPATNTLSGSQNLENSCGFSEAFQDVEDDFGDFQQGQGVQSFGNVEKLLELNPSASSSTAATSVNPEIICNTGGLDFMASFPDSKTNEEPSVVQDTASVTPSFETLMKKSLMLNKPSQTSVRKFDKPAKLPKIMKSQPSHFSESAKASKWDNLESLSDMFTIPQPAAAVVELESSYDDHQSHGIDNNSDDWSDFSGTDQSGALFQEQTNQGLHVVTSPGQIITENKQVGPQENEMFGVPSGFSGMQLVDAWRPATQVGANIGGVIPKMENMAMLQEMNGGTETATGNDVVLEQTYGTQLENQGLAMQDVDSQESYYDPEKQLYGVHLPEWSKDTSMLPAVYKQIHQICSSDSTDILSTSQLYPILLSSDLPRDKLSHIWFQCNKAIPGELNEQELYLILGMVALAQVGLQINKLTLEKLTSCTTAPIPSFPENIFQNDSDTVLNVRAPQTSINNEVGDKCVDSSETGVITGTLADSNFVKISPYTINAVKQPDWSRWKTSKAGHVDDKFTDFQIIVPKDQSASFQGSASSTLSNLNFVNTLVTSNALDTFGTFQTSALAVQAPLTGGQGSTDNPLDISVPSMALSGNSSNSIVLNKPSKDNNRVTCNSQDLLPEFPSFSTADASADDTGNSFGDFASATGSCSIPESQMNAVENKMFSTAPAPPLLMSVPLQASQRYALTGEDETIDHHEKAWLKCITSCSVVIMKSCQILQSVTDPYLLEEIFSSPQGISHFSAMIEIYGVSQRVKASILKSAPNNKKLKESLQNIENVWKVCLGFQSFKALLPSQSMNFSGCHINEDDDLNLTCGVCLLNVDKSWVASSANKGRSGKLSYGSRYYHTTCANFWCNKVDSVLPALQLNVGNSLI